MNLVPRRCWCAFAEEYRRTDASLQTNKDDQLEVELSSTQIDAADVRSHRLYFPGKCQSKKAKQPRFKSSHSTI